jgi:hypothetical protein
VDEAQSEQTTYTESIRTNGRPKSSITGGETSATVRFFYSIYIYVYISLAALQGMPWYIRHNLVDTPLDRKRRNDLFSVYRVRNMRRFRI